MGGLRSNSGFALAEVMVAAALLVAIAVGVTQIIAQSVRASFAARTRTVATVLAMQRMEQLRALTWNEAFDAATGVLVPASDIATNLSTDPATAGGPGLAPSPQGTLDANLPPYVDYLDSAGNWVGNGAAPPRAAVYIRRWSVAALESHPDSVRVLQVLVTSSRTPSGLPPARGFSGDAWLVSVKTRRGR